MNRKELTDELAGRLGISKQLARSAIEAIFSPVPGRGILAERLVRGEKVVVTGFGTFFARPARRGAAPSRRGGGDERPVPASRRRTAAFRCGLPLRDRLC